MSSDPSSYKPSAYLHVINRQDGAQVIVSMLYGTNVVVVPDLQHEAASLLSGEFDSSGNKSILFKEFVSSNVLIPKELDELNFMRRKYLTKRFSGDSLGLTIAPTIDCNLACPYCYEDKRASRMSAEVETQVVNYVERNLPNKKLLRVMWYGGEPLMCRDTVLRLTHKFSRIADREGAAFRSSMTTNGFLLTEGVAKRLAELDGWDFFQLTLDGTAAFHDVKRPTKSGRGTFDVVYRNLVSATDFLPIVLRMNVDRLNWSGCSELLDILARDINAPKLKVYFSPIHPYGEGCRDIADSPDVSIFDNEIFSSIEAELRAKALSLGFRTTDPVPSKTCSTCQAVSTHSVVIEPDGTLQRCWTEVGDKSKSVGHIGDAIDLSSQNSIRWLSYDPTSTEPCRSCEVLPLCFGGCPQRHLDGRPIEMICSSIKYQLKNELNLAYGGKARISPPKIPVKSIPIRAL